MISLAPNVEVWGHEDARVSRKASKEVFDLLGHAVFKNVDFTHTWKNNPDSSVEFKLGSISLVDHSSPGHARDTLHYMDTVYIMLEIYCSPMEWEGWICRE